MSKLNLRRVIPLLFIFCAVLAVTSPAQSFKTLANFDYATGATPLAGLVQGTDGNFYGTAYNGGSSNCIMTAENEGCGTVFKVTPEGVLTLLYTFCAQFPCSDGSTPLAGLLQATNGNFYGATSGGGASSICTFGCGTVFKITPAGVLTVLHSFGSTETDGQGPNGLVQGGDGNLYGTTGGGGTDGRGTVFKITPEGTLTVLHSFCAQAGCTDGAGPDAALVQGTDGNFYGTTRGGGSSSVCSGGCGTVFKITPEGKLTVLHSFDGTDGSEPRVALVQATDGNFYGTTSEGGASSICSGGCGTVFKITPAGVLTVLHSFGSTETDGQSPEAGLVQGTDGNFYGTTSEGGAGRNGTVFKIMPGGTLTTLHNFDYTGGSYPEAGLVQGTNGTFYGTTSYGGPDCVIAYCGTVYSRSVGLEPFVETRPTSGKIDTPVIILGNNLTGSTSVTFNGKAAKFKVVSSTEITTTVPMYATTGKVSVKTPGRTLISNVNFRVP
jgi:uncharacterized repeat protein (TIGR03803 family)